jgi:crotonobetainyl-CoA:carnitine CoA-transferase CaiB-like acyl-CoA transferase
VAITVGDDEQWAALASVIDAADDDARFVGVAGRVAHHDELDELIGAWTARHTASEVATWLQEAGVPAHEVLDNIGVIHDPQVHDRHWFQMVDSARFPEGDAFSGHPIRLTESPGHWWRAGPSMGQDTVEILTGRAGLEQAHVDELLASGAAFTDSAPEQTLQRPYSDYAEILGVRGSAG